MPDRFLIQEDLAYGPRGRQRLNLCSPPTSDGAPFPAVVMMHGGGWNHGDKGGMMRWCRTLAMQGFVAASINYRLIDAAHWPAQIVDAQLAVRWLRANAGPLNIDPRRISAVGASAGAHLAVYLAAVQHAVAGDDAGELADISSQIACAVSVSGPVDLTTQRMQRHARLLVGPLAPEAAAARIEDASPLRLIGPRTAPILIVHGDVDTVVIPEEQAEPLYEAMRQHGRPVEKHYFPGGHDRKALPPDQLAAMEQAMWAFVSEFGR